MSPTWSRDKDGETQGGDEERREGGKKAKHPAERTVGLLVVCEADETL